ncbi:MAG: hypothetical protein J1F63_03900 [Oscillospiraceae bacterium]|nr:hypothetical protein [Oscillospiraceae bacterium]
MKNKLRETKFTKILVCIILPFLIPFLMEFLGNFMNNVVKWIITAIFVFLDILGIIYFQVKDSKDKKTFWENKAARFAYSSTYELNERKRDYLVNISYNTKFYIDNKYIPYDVHEYLTEICKSFANVMSNITNINKENMSVSFIYRYTYQDAKQEDKDWKWVVGRELTMLRPLNEYVSKKETVYNQLINGNDTAVFCNDKASLSNKRNPEYYMSARDERHNRIGSFFAAKIMFSNNADNFCEGIFMISTYGKRFVENNDKYEVDSIRRLIVDDVFPCYQRLLEAELGILYFRHEK